MAMSSILDVGGLSVGNAHDAKVKTGVTVILPDNPAPASVDVRGGGPGTREIMAMADGGLIENVHAIVLSGGSVYGLAAADAVTSWLGAKGVGYAAGPPPIPVSPIVPSAILFDNGNGGDKAWGEAPPFFALGRTACEAASPSQLTQGKAGAGYGATAGLYPGGLGSASASIGGITAGAIIAANPVGSPYMPGTQCPWAWLYEVDKEFGGARPPADYTLKPARDTKLEFLKSAGQSTVIGCVAVNAALSQKELKRLAIMAQDGISMAVRPAHTPLDGDTIFAVSTGDRSLFAPRPASLAALGHLCAVVVARALMKAVYLAAPKA